jgi:molecular chaperone GrpE
MNKKKVTEPTYEEVLLQLDMLTEALQRERADAVNIRRRYEEELSRVRIAAKARVITDLLPVIDNFDLALKHVPADLEDNEYIKGVRGIVKKFEKVLETMGVEPIESLGKDFDPHLHEAVSMEEGEGTREVVTAVLQRGYRIGDEVIRHERVRVSPQE